VDYGDPEALSTGDIVTASLIFILIAVIQRLTFRTLLANITSSQENQKLLSDTVTELQETKTNLEFRVSERTKQLQVANEVSRVAGAVLDPDEIVNRVVNLITDQFGYYYAAIFLVDENYLWANLKDATGDAGKTLLGRNHRLQIGGQSMVGTAVAEGSAIVALDVGDEAIRFNNPLLPNTRSEIALPLIAGNRSLGALDVQSSEESAFNEDSIEILQNMANQVAVALENARLFQESQERLNQLNRYFYQGLKTEIRSVAFQDNSVLINPENENGVPAESFSQTHTTVQMENDISVASVPVVVGNRTLGVIRLEIEGREWSSDEVAIFDAIATQAASKLENLQLIEETQKRAQQEQITNEITTSIRETLNLETILKTATESIREKFELPEVLIQLTPPEDQA
jgi:GAF domain-containing protein